MTSALRPVLSGLCSVRLGLAVLFHLFNLLIGTQQMNLSIAIPAMVNVTVPPADAQAGGNGTAKEPEALVSVTRPPTL